MSPNNKIGITEVAIRDHMKTLNEGQKCEVCCTRHKGKWVLIISITDNGAETNYVMSSQREKVRTFATLEAARNACDFIGGMTVIGK
jgi:hypothetical protein